MISESVTACSLLCGLWGLILNSCLSSAIDLDPTRPDQIISAANLIATDLVSLYATPSDPSSTNLYASGYKILSGIPGLLPQPPYYWWEAGAMFGSLIEYWYYTGDETYNELVREGIVFQIGEGWDLMPANQSNAEGNDDQLFWAFTCMTAAELNFPAPPSPYPGWLALAQSVMNQLIVRWNAEIESQQISSHSHDQEYQECPEALHGGLRWQIYPWLNGYNYKNVAANGGMFQLGARLARFTGNDTYREWAERAWEWLAESPLLMVHNGTVWDGIDIGNGQGCGGLGEGEVIPDRKQWSYNYGIVIAGAAYMQNHTSTLPTLSSPNTPSTWLNNVTVLLNTTTYTFFNTTPEGQVTMYERCEPSGKCNIDQWSFKAYLSRWLAVTAQLVPSTANDIMPLLRDSAKGAGRVCESVVVEGPSEGAEMRGVKGWKRQDGGAEGGNGEGENLLQPHLCGSQWQLQQSDLRTGVGQQLSALSVVQSCLVDTSGPNLRGPYSSDDGGTSVGDPGLGMGKADEVGIVYPPLGTGERVGAGFLTGALVCGWAWWCWWLGKEDRVFS